MLSLCNGWEFTKEWSEDFLAGLGYAEAVRLPHTVQEGLSGSPDQLWCWPREDQVSRTSAHLLPSNSPGVGSRKRVQS